MPPPQPERADRTDKAEKAAEAYKRQALRCLNGLLAKLGIRVTLTSELQITFDIIQQLACVYFRVPAIPSGSARPGGAAPSPEQSMLNYITHKLGIATEHISAKGLHENNVFDCLLLLEIVYTLLKSDDMPHFPQMTEEIATAILQQQQDAATRDLMEVQAEYMEREERRKDARGILGAREILDAYADRKSGPAPPSVPRMQRKRGAATGGGSAGGGAAGTSASGTGAPDDGEAAGDSQRSQRPQTRDASGRGNSRGGARPVTASGSSGASGSGSAAARAGRQQAEIEELVDTLYDNYLRDWVDTLHPVDPRNPGDKLTAAARARDQKRVKGKLYRLVGNVMREIHRKETEMYSRLQQRINEALKRATAIERENRRLEEQARRDEAERLRHEEWKTQVALETRRANEQQMRKERDEEAARIAKINRESNLREDKSRQSRREDELFDKIAAALQRESDRRLRFAVENFDLSDGEIDQIVVSRLREYAAAERVVTDGGDEPASARVRH